MTISTDELRRLFTYDAITGKLYSRVRRGKLGIGSECGAIIPIGYVFVGLGQRRYAYAHRIAWQIVHGDIPAGLVIDHINGVVSDNRLCNLRLVTRSINQRNQKRYKNNTSGRTGVHWYKPYGNWRTEIRVSGVDISLGYFNNFNDAVVARQNAERRYGFHINHGRHGRILQE
jgi:hypothetical protein